MSDENTTPTTLFAEIGNDEEFKNRYGELIGSGMSAVIYARDGIAAKVFREGQIKKQAYQEAYTMTAVEGYGICAPKIYGVETCCGRTVVLMDQIKGISILDMMGKNPDKISDYLDIVVQLQKEMHKVESWEFRPLRMLLKGNIAASPGLSQEEKTKLSEKLSTMPDEFYLCHGDFHGGNILFDGESYKIIDWAEVASGSPAADACRSYLDYSMLKMEIAEEYLQKYCSATGKKREDILAWLPVVTGAVYGYLSTEAQKITRQFF
jgi:tRNA A-37 threonylcarbamoyl transferase component Bud32